MFYSLYINEVDMKLLVVGSRSIENLDLSKYITEEVSIIISGGAKGVDTLAENYADKHGISKLVLRPNYSVYGKAAPIIRNKQMVDICDNVLIIWDGKSNGTKYTIEYAKKCGKQFTLVIL